MSKIYNLISKCIVTPLTWANTVQLWLQDRLNQTLAGRAKKLTTQAGVDMRIFLLFNFQSFSSGRTRSSKCSVFAPLLNNF